MKGAPSADYVAGYVDAKGRFKSKPRPSFSVSGDKVALNIIRDVIGAEGRLRVVRVGNRVYWRLEYTTRSELLKVAKFFETNPLIVRAAEFAAFKRALSSWRPRFNVSPKLAERVRAMYEDGLPLELIAERVDAPLSSVVSVIYGRYGLRARLGDRKSIVRDFLSGKPVKQIAGERELRVSTVYEVLRKKLGKSVIEDDVLAALRQEPLTTDELAKRLGVTPNALSSVLGRLAARGLIRKAGKEWRVS